MQKHPIPHAAPWLPENRRQHDTTRGSPGSPGSHHRPQGCDYAATLIILTQGYLAEQHRLLRLGTPATRSSHCRVTPLLTIIGFSVYTILHISHIQSGGDPFSVTYLLNNLEIIRGANRTTWKNTHRAWLPSYSQTWLTAQNYGRFFRGGWMMRLPGMMRS